MTESFVGIDVSKRRLEVAVKSVDRPQRFHQANSTGGIRTVVDRLSRLKPVVVVMEATGGYERDVRVALGEVGIPVHVANPQRTKAFSVAVARHAKTDPVDASTLAEFAEKLKPAPTLPVDPGLEALQALLARRLQLVDMRAMELNRVGTTPADQRSDIAELISFLSGQIRRLEQSIGENIRANPAWWKQDRLLQTAKGVGPVLSATLIAFLPELGTLSHKQLASLVGVAPHARDSGTKKGKRFIQGGRGQVRRVLYMGTLADIRWDPNVRALYRRLAAREKLPKVIIVACMHKLLRILNAMTRRGTTWNPDWKNQIRPPKNTHTHRNELAGHTDLTSEESPVSMGSTQPVPTSVPTVTIPNPSGGA